MKNKAFNRYYVFACLGVLAASIYPLYMGIRVIADMAANGAVLKENYPKYIIPYTPICIAVLIGVIILPVCIKLLRRFALVGGSAAAVSVFFAVETLLEQNVVIGMGTAAKLEDWQMYMCIITPNSKFTALDILLGNYSPAFKLHFYMISVVLILAVLNCLYGFGRMIKTGDKRRLKALILQSVFSFIFLGLCILACFTAFWRDGSIQVSPLSAVLMSIFFLFLSLTSGIYIGSFLLGKRKFVSVGIPAIASCIITLLMYVGEMILLNGRLYRFGVGFLFEGIPGIILAPVDLLIIILSGCISAFIFKLLNRKKEPNT